MESFVLFFFSSKLTAMASGKRRSRRPAPPSLARRAAGDALLTAAIPALTAIFVEASCPIRHRRTHRFLVASSRRSM
jgi:hypothetical protein